jgi:hypothetical protein
MNLSTAWRMLPLVGRIAADLLETHHERDKVQPELERLDRRKRDLTWPQRQRRYVLQQQLGALNHHYQAVCQEIRELGLAVIDAEAGRIGFPTLVNNRAAYFAWWPGEEEIRYWHFAEEVQCRTIPTAWLQSEGITLSGKS